MQAFFLAPHQTATNQAIGQAVRGGGHSLIAGT